MRECWTPIEDLPDDWPSMRSTLLASLASKWETERGKLTDPESIRDFNKRMVRQWAIETGILENLYNLDRGITNTLIEKGIRENVVKDTADAANVIAMIRDHEDTLEGVFEFIKGERPLSKHYIKTMHQSLTKHQETCEAINQFGGRTEIPLIRGDWKREPNNPTRPDGTLHEYCPPEHVDSEMEHLVEMHLRHMRDGIDIEVEAAWLHHRFVQVHPFQDGNGRVARTLSSLVLMKAGLFPMTVDREEKGAYIDALERADHGDLAPLVDLVARMQSETVTRALKASEYRPVSASFGITKVVDALVERFEEWVAEIGGDAEFRQLARDLIDLGLNKLSSFSIAELDGRPILHYSDPEVRDQSTLPGEKIPYRRQKRKGTQKIDEFIDVMLLEGRRGVSLKLEAVAEVHATRTVRSRAEFFVLLAPAGPARHGLIGAVAEVAYPRLFSSREEWEGLHFGHPGFDLEVQPYVQLACARPFQAAVDEPRGDVKARFEEWLGECLAIALTQWHARV